MAYCSTAINIAPHSGGFVSQDRWKSRLRIWGVKQGFQMQQQLQQPPALRRRRVDSPSGLLVDAVCWKIQIIDFQRRPPFLHTGFRRKFEIRAATTEEVEAEKELIEEDAIERMEKSLESVRGNFNTVRTGRASPALLDRVEVEYYGALVILKSIAQVSTPDGSTILVQPFDKSSLASIEKAINKSDVGLTPTNDGSVIRLYIPPLTSERRKDLLKLVSKLSEEGKIAIRNIRREAIKSYEKLEKEKKLSEDNVKDFADSMQKITDSYIKKIDDIFKQKEKELLTV